MVRCKTGLGSFGGMVRSKVGVIAEGWCQGWDVQAKSGVVARGWGQEWDVQAESGVKSGLVAEDWGRLVGCPG